MTIVATSRRATTITIAMPVFLGGVMISRGLSTTRGTRSMVTARGGRSAVRGERFMALKFC